MPLATIPTAEESQLANQKTEGMLISAGPVKPIQATREEGYAEKLSAVEGLQNLGPIFKSSDVIELTELETEFVVRCVKHCYNRYIVLQFDCTNTLSDLLLENVKVQVDPSEGYVVLKEIPAVRIPYNDKGTSYTLLQFPQELPQSVGTFGAVLKFTAKDCDPSTGIPDSDEG